MQVNQIGLYGGFIENYEEAVQVVRKCTQSDPRFRTLAEVLKTLLQSEYMNTQLMQQAWPYQRDLVSCFFRA